MITERITTEPKRFDLICLGRLAVDLYGEQLGVELEDVRSFAKYLGGSSANIAAGCARLGLSVSMLSRVGNEQMGRFLKQTLQKEGCDTDHIVTDNERLTALAILSIRNQEQFPLLFYRDNCADMALSEQDIQADHIAAAKALLITGTHFSTPGVQAASSKALEYAQQSGTLRVLDIDYRPVLWGLTNKGDGDTRFIASRRVTEHMQSILPFFDLVVGTEEELNIAGGNTDLMTSLRNIRQHTDATLLVKLGADGCAIIDGDIPASIDQAFFYTGFQVEVLNVLGAGDAFLSGFLSGLLRGQDYETCCTLANACGALVVSRHACSPSMPTPDELHYFLENRQSIERIDKDAALNLLHSISQADRDWQDMAILAFDHRHQFVDMARQAGADLSKITALKKLLLTSFEQAVATKGIEQRCGVLVDDTWGTEALYQVTGSGAWIGRPVEQPGSRPLEFEGGRNVGLRLVSWPTEHVVKCLVFYHPDDDANLRYEQERQIIELFQCCRSTGHQLLLEIIPPRGMPVDDDTMARTLQRMYNLDIHPHWWKLPAQSAQSWRQISALITKRSPHCRGVLLLGLDVDSAVLQETFSIAAKFPLCKGFAVGRSIFRVPSEQWLAGNIDDAQLIQQVSNNYLELVDLWDRSRI